MNYLSTLELTKDELFFLRTLFSPTPVDFSVNSNKFVLHSLKLKVDSAVKNLQKNDQQSFFNRGFSGYKHG